LAHKSMSIPLLFGFRDPRLRAQLRFFQPWVEHPIVPRQSIGYI
jgi:hypothetical protein